MKLPFKKIKDKGITWKTDFLAEMLPLLHSDSIMEG